MSQKAAIARTHGLSHTSEYDIWQGLRRRCTSPAAINYSDYGGRGIKVCERWKRFENFYADMGPRPSNRHSIDRIDNNGNYEPENCRWATWHEQATNKRRHPLEFTPAQLRAARALLGWSQTELAERCGIGQVATVKRFETGKSDPKQSTLLAWRRALSKAGVLFIEDDGTNGPGVRLRDPQR